MKGQGGILGRRLNKLAQFKELVQSMDDEDEKPPKSFVGVNLALASDV